MHSIVFSVKIDSPKKYQVKKGNTIYERTAAINLTDHSSPTASMQYLVPHQKHNPAGVPMTIVDSRALSFQNSQTSCAFVANQPRACPITKNDIAINISLLKNSDSFDI